MAKLADAQGLKPCTFKGVWVRGPLSAPRQEDLKSLGIMFQ